MFGNNFWLLSLSFFFITGCSDTKTEQNENNMTDVSDLQSDDVGVDSLPDGSDGITPETSSVVGRAVKGPFVENSEVVVYELDSAGDRTIVKRKGRTNKDGQFLMGDLHFDGWSEVEVIGYYYDEVSGKVSDAKRTLRMLTKITDGKIDGNINLLTGFIAKRTRVLFQTEVVSTIEEGRERARSELGQIFYTSHFPIDLSILNHDAVGRSFDNTILLWFSAAVIAAGISDTEFDEIVNDFREDGKINDIGLGHFLSIKQEASKELYSDARYRLIDRYGSAPPNINHVEHVNYWINTNCYYGQSLLHQKICVGINEGNSMAVPLEGVSNYSFVAPSSGTYMISTRFSEFHNYNTWRLSTTDGAKIDEGTTTNAWRSVSPLLLAGQEYYLKVSNAGDVQSLVKIEIHPSSEGGTHSPYPVMYNTSKASWIGFQTEMKNPSQDSYYVFYTDQTLESSVDIKVSDIAEEMELSVYKAHRDEKSEDVFGDPDHLHETVSGTNAIEIEGVGTGREVLYIHVHNKGRLLDQKATGRTPFKLTIH